MTSTLRLPILLVTAALASSCITPGKYRVYRVANTITVSQLDCSAGMPPTGGVVSDSFRTGQTFGIFASDGSTFWLDLADRTLEGERTGAGEFAFEGERVNVTPSQDAITNDIERWSVDLEISGRKISGTTITENITTCQGSACGQGSNTSCTTVTDWEGSEVKDAELQHPI